jgi:uncharacterized protein YyaL (SSP411 family)
MQCANWDEPTFGPEKQMNVKRMAATAVLTFIALSHDSYLNAQSPPQIDWVQTEQKAISLARRFNLPILVYVKSSDCGYCRKMEREVWSNPQIIAMVDAGFIPLELNAERDAETVAAMGIRAFPTTLIFTPNVQFVNGAPGYMPPNQVAGLLRSGQPLQTASQTTLQQP